MSAAAPLPRRLRRLLAAGLVAACAGGAAAPAASAREGAPQFAPVYRPLIVVKLPALPWSHRRPKDLGYLPAVGPNELRWQEKPAPVARPLARTAARLYDPPASEEKPTPAPAAEPAAPEPTAEAPAEKPRPRTTAPGSSPLRAEDFLPFFEKPAEVAPGADDGDRTPFVPANPTLPESKAEFRLK